MFLVWNWKFEGDNKFKDVFCYHSSLYANESETIIFMLRGLKHARGLGPSEAVGDSSGIL